MDNIKMTDLRHKSKEVVKSLEQGQSIDLIYRSQIIGQIIPKKTEKTKVIESDEEAAELINTLQSITTTKMSSKKARLLYRKKLEKKHGKHLS